MLGIAEWIVWGIAAVFAVAYSTIGIYGLVLYFLTS